MDEQPTKVNATRPVRKKKRVDSYEDKDEEEDDEREYKYVVGNGEDGYSADDCCVGIDDVNKVCSVDNFTDLIGTNHYDSEENSM